ncbi:MAG: heme-binding protein [Chryseobacterium sp.]
MNYIYALIGIVFLWSLWGYFSSRVENTQYSVLESKTGYEVRLYPEHIVAQTTVKGTYKEALNEGFRIVAGYIFGGNTKRESIAMTAPVIEKKSASESIAMTAPVMANIEGEAHTITFGMPKSYTLETLPTPDDPRVKIETVNEKKMAAIRFSWIRTDSRVQSKKQELLDALKKDNVLVIGEPQYAGYNAPWTPPWMMRSEVLVEVR